MARSVLKIVAILLALMPMTVAAQTAQRSVTIEADATVKSVDAETRKIVLENLATGQTEVIVAGPEVVNFDQIDAGDTVKAIYTLGDAARVTVPGETDTLTEVDGLATEGQKPGALAATAVTLVLEFLAFDANTSVATVKNSAGEEVEIDVETEAGRAFAGDLSAGEMVALTFAEGLAIGIVER